MRVSVIVPVYNVERYLRQCLDSLAAQTLDDVEFVCVDDGSTDSSPAILAEYAARDSRFRVISKPNAGYGHTLNRGIAEARGDYVGVLESDDFCDPRMFETLVDAAVEHDLDIARAEYRLYWSAPAGRSERVRSEHGIAYGRVFDPRDVPGCFLLPPALWSMLVRRQLIVDNALALLESPGASYQDTAFSFKVWACARRAMVLDECFLSYRQDNEASSINQKGKLACVPAEYAEIDRFLRADPARFGELLPAAAARRFGAYAWNYARMDASLHAEFAELMARDMRAADAEGLLDKGLFSSDEWSDVHLVMRDPARYVALHDAPDDGAALRRYRKRARLKRALTGR